MKLVYIITVIVFAAYAFFLWTFERRYHRLREQQPRTLVFKSREAMQAAQDARVGDLATLISRNGLVPLGLYRCVKVRHNDTSHRAQALQRLGRRATEWEEIPLT